MLTCAQRLPDGTTGKTMQATVITLLVAGVGACATLCNTYLASRLSRTNKRDHGEVAAALEDLKEQTSGISDKVDGHLMWHLNDPSVAISSGQPEGERPA